MKTFTLLAVLVLCVSSVFAIACGDKPPQDPSTVDTDAAAPSESPAPAPTSTSN